LERLQRQAAAAGGALWVLNGNHETMNVGGNFRYATQGGLCLPAATSGVHCGFCMVVRQCFMCHITCR
jgi:hypothetical protein